MIGCELRFWRAVSRLTMPLVIGIHHVTMNLEDHSKPHVIAKKKSPRAASYASR
jgi:hypothetical protein